MFVLVALPLILTVCVCFVVTMLITDPSINNIAGALVGSGLLVAITKSIISMSSYAGNKVFDPRLLPKRTSIALASLSICVGLALYVLWTRCNYC